MGEKKKIFWTGGWDSTFRLLQLLINEEKTVEPYYLIDHQRRSYKLEIDRMEQIRERIINKYDHTKEQLIPVTYYNFEDIKLDIEIVQAWREIKNDRHFGYQYKWLASFCKQHGLNEIELCVDRRDNEKEPTPTLADILISENLPAQYHTLFQYFSLPLIGLSKTDMIQIATKNGWEDILTMTWFCHHPIHIPFYGEVACGICNPCRIAVWEGFGDRIPLINRYAGSILKKAYHNLKLNRFR